MTDRLGNSAPPVALVVEDEWLLRQEIVDELQKAGWHVREADTGTEALHLVRQNVAIQLLITDINLADRVTGWEVAEAYRQANVDGLVVYVTGNPAIERRLVRRSVFMNKPIRMDELAAICRNQL